MDINEKLNNLTEKSVWYFAKQETSFDKVFDACCLLAAYPDEAATEVFENHKGENGVVSNYRILSVAQLFGLLSKSNPFQRNGSSYDKEELTPVFYSLKNAGKGSADYELIKAEQMLKLRIRAVTDSTDNIADYSIYPLLYSCEVLWLLHKKGIDEVPKDKFYTYVMTSKTYAELQDTVKFLMNPNSPISHFISQYKSDTRMDSLIQKNSDYLVWSKESVRLNPKHETFFRQMFDGAYRCVLNVLYSIVENIDAYQAIQTQWIGFNKEEKLLEVAPLPKVLSNSSEIASKYRPYITAIKSKPFLLLAGISGTGKSRIVRELARACWEDGTPEYKAHKPKNYEMVQVKPNWHDSSELIGYVSRLGEEPAFIAGDFLKFIVKAWENRHVPYFLCLDEMNLAPVEQYFAEYLSVVESRKKDEETGDVVTDPILKPEYEAELDEKTNERVPKAWYKNLINELLVECPDEKQFGLYRQFIEKGISIPQNLIVVGTVNMDETTFSFSRKVLDRAMTIEMNEVNLAGGLTQKHETIGKLNYDDLVGTNVEGVDVYADYQAVCDKAIEYLKSINDVLEGTPFKVAYRTRNEFLLYVVNNLPYHKDEAGNELSEEAVVARALDEITSMKVLSRIEGDDQKVSQELLDGLKQVVSDMLPNDAMREASVSLAKLREMNKRCESGFTSFWS